MTPVRGPRCPRGGACDVAACPDAFRCGALPGWGTSPWLVGVIATLPAVLSVGVLVVGAVVGPPVNPVENANLYIALTIGGATLAALGLALERRRRAIRHMRALARVAADLGLGLAARPPDVRLPLLHIGRCAGSHVMLNGEVGGQRVLYVRYEVVINTRASNLLFVVVLPDRRLAAPPFLITPRRGRHSFAGVLGRGFEVRPEGEGAAEAVAARTYLGSTSQTEFAAALDRPTLHALDAAPGWTIQGIPRRPPAELRVTSGIGAVPHNPERAEIERLAAYLGWPEGDAGGFVLAWRKVREAPIVLGFPTDPAAIEAEIRGAIALKERLTAAWAGAGRRATFRP